VRVSLSSHISLLNEWQSLSKRTQFLRYNHEHHGCKGTSFVFGSRIGSEHRCIEYRQWRAEQRRCVTTNSIGTRKSLLERHALNRSYRFIIWYIASKLTVSTMSQERMNYNHNHNHNSQLVILSERIELNIASSLFWTSERVRINWQRISQVKDFQREC